MPKTAAPTRKPTAAQEAAKANREKEKTYKDKVLARAMKRRARAWHVRLIVWLLLRVAPVGLFWALVLRPEFRTWTWALVCTIVPVDMIPLVSQWAYQP